MAHLLILPQNNLTVLNNFCASAPKACYAYVTAVLEKIFSRDVPLHMGIWKHDIEQSELFSISK